MMKEKADGGDDLAKALLDTFGEKADGVLVRFVRARKYDVPRAFDLMKGASSDRRPRASRRSLTLLASCRRLRALQEGLPRAL